MISKRIYLCEKILCLIAFTVRGCVAPVLKEKYGNTKVVTPYGAIRGISVEFSDSKSSRYVEGYFGLQFASVHSLALRFSVPDIPKERWNLVRVFKNCPSCPQAIQNEKVSNFLPEGFRTRLNRLKPSISKMTEDCLRLNIYVPKREWNDTSKLPVMVFVHGESYEIGTGNAYEGSVLASYGEVIVVTVNYRLGVLGFLSTGDQEATGNYALWDLFAVLSWINDNIGAFGGDTNRVTLFGHGYGAALVNILLLSPMVETRLVQRAIIQSGSALSPWAVSFDAVACTQWLAVNVQCDQFLSDSKLLINCLRGKTATELVENVPLPPKYYSCFAPTPGGGMFPESVRDLLKSKKGIFSKIPVMFGVTRNEAYSYLKQRELVEGISKERKAQIIRTFVHNLYRYHRQKLYEIIDFQYTEWNKEQDKNTTRDNVMDMLSDSLYVAPVVEMAQEHAKSASDTYFYNFGYSTQSEDFPQWSSGVHGDELPYVFGAPLVDGISPFPSRYTKNEKKLSASVMRFWTNFAKSGNPNLPVKDTDHEKFADLEWPKYDLNRQRYLHIETNPCFGNIGEETCWDSLGKRPQVKHHYRGSELALWMDLIPKIDTPPDPNSGVKTDPIQHKLRNSENLSSFDDPDYLISKQRYQRLFPMPPPTPPTSRGFVNDGNIVTEQPSFDNVGGKNYPTTPRAKHEYSTVISKDVTTEKKPVAEGIKHDSIANSSVPLSITVAIGCSLLFINILIYAGVYYQRERIKKLKQGEASNAASAHNTDNSNDPSGREMTAVHVNHISNSLSNSKSDVHNNPVYSVISKQANVPDKYAYTQVPTNTNSPIHRTRVPHSQTNSIAGSDRSGSSLNHTGGKPPDRSPAGSDRNINRNNQNPSSGSTNAITIV